MNYEFSRKRQHYKDFQKNLCKSHIKKEDEFSQNLLHFFPKYYRY